jgi:hypothetical protein
VLCEEGKAAAPAPVATTAVLEQPPVRLAA